MQLESSAAGQARRQTCLPPRLVSVNKAGVPTHVSGGVYYCGRDLVTDRIPGSDGRCGPADGPQCDACRDKLSFNTNSGLCRSHCVECGATCPGRAPSFCYVINLSRAKPSSQPAERVRAIPEVQESEAKASTREASRSVRARSYGLTN
jgi:hypothetical protein